MKSIWHKLFPIKETTRSIIGAWAERHRTLRERICQWTTPGKQWGQSTSDLNYYNHKQ